MGKIRDYRDEVYNRLCEQIDQINSTTFSSVTDFFGDSVLTLGKWAGILKLDENVRDTKKYHKRVLDMNDTTKKELKDIFEKVEKVDNSFSKDIAAVNSRQQIYFNKIKKLHEMITPSGEIKSAKYIRTQCEPYNKQLDAADKKIQPKYVEQLNYSMKKEAIEGAVGSIGSIVKLGADIVTMPASWMKAFATGGPVGFAKEWLSDTWGLINDLYSVAGNLSGYHLLWFGEIGYLITRNPYCLSATLEKTEGMTGAAGLYDTLEAREKAEGKDKFTTSMKKGAKFMDHLDTTVGLLSDGKDLLKDPKGVILPKNPMKHSILHKADMTQEAQKNYKRIQNFYNKFEKEANVAKTTKMIYSYAEEIYNSGVSGGVVKETFENSKLWKDLCKIVDYKETYKLE